MRPLEWLNVNPRAAALMPLRVIKSVYSTNPRALTSLTNFDAVQVLIFLLFH